MGAENFGVVFFDVAADLGKGVVPLLHGEDNDAALAPSRLLPESGQRIGNGDYARILVPLIDDGHQLNLIFNSQLHYAVEVLVGAHKGIGVAQG